MKKSILVIGSGSIGMTTARLIAAYNLPTDIEVIDLNEISPAEARKKLEEYNSHEKEKPLVIKCHANNKSILFDPVVPHVFIEKPIKPKYNSRFNGKKKFF